MNGSYGSRPDFNKVSPIDVVDHTQFEVFAKRLADVGAGCMVVALAVKLADTGQLKPSLKILAELLRTGRHQTVRDIPCGIPVVAWSSDDSFMTLATSRIGMRRTYVFRQPKKSPATMTGLELVAVKSELREEGKPERLHKESDTRIEIYPAIVQARIPKPTLLPSSKNSP